MARDPRVPPPIPAAAAANPYAAPEAHVADVLPGTSEAEAIRTAHIRHERQLKGIGSLYVLGAAFWLIGGGVMTALSFVGEANREGGMAFTLGLGAFYLAIGGLSAAVATGFRRLRPWVKVPGGIFSALGLLVFPIGTLINGAILYALFCEKGRTILSPEYAAIIAATPHVKFRYTTTEKVVLAVLGAILVGVAVLIYIGVRGR